MQHCGPGIIEAVKAKRRRSSIGSSSSDLGDDDGGHLLTKLQAVHFPTQVHVVMWRIISVIISVLVVCTESVFVGRGGQTVACSRVDPTRRDRTAE